MSRRALVLSLALLQTATLLSGTAAVALARTGSTTVEPQVVALVPQEPTLRPTRHLAQAKAVRKATPRATPTPRPRQPVRHVQPRRTSPRVVVRHHSATPEERVMRAVRRIPGYRSGDAVWTITPSYGHWGVADLYSGVIYISPTVPADRVYDVVAHEWSHLLSVKAYGGDVTNALAAMNAYFGGSDLTGAERAADCMARVLGATWTHYTACTSSHWRDGARRLISRQHL